MGDDATHNDTFQAPGSARSKGVRPRSKVSSRRVLRGTAKAKPAMVQTQVRERSGSLGQGLTVAGNESEQLRKATQGVSVMRCCKRRSEKREHAERAQLATHRSCLHWCRIGMDDA